MENYRFHGDGFSLIFFLICEMRKQKSQHRVRLVEPVLNMYYLTLKGQFEI